MKKWHIFISVFLCLSAIHAQPQPWSEIHEGHLFLGNDSLKVVLVTSTEGDTLTAVMDSPDQYINDIPVTSIRFIGDTLRLEVASIGVTFRGTVCGDTIRGKFRQYGRALPLTLKPTQERLIFRRPQEPRRPFPYQEIELTFSHKDGEPPTCGTLTLPPHKPYATIVLISGSGWQDRNESVCGHQPFLVLADSLTRCGYAVFRYDDAPVHRFNHLTTYDFAEQVGVIMDTLSRRPELQGLPLGLLGHSEGSMVAFIAGATHQPDFIISLAGVGTSMREVLLYQTMTLGAGSHWEEGMLRNSLLINDRIYRMIEKSKHPDKAKREIQKFLQRYTANMADTMRQQLHLTDIEINAICSTVTSDWFFAVMHLNISQYIRKIQCPVLVLNGDKDAQVDGVQNIHAIISQLPHPERAHGQLLEGLNHLFQECETGLPDEYGKIEQTLSPLLLRTVIQWLELFKK